MTSHQCHRKILSCLPHQFMTSNEWPVESAPCTLYKVVFGKKKKKGKNGKLQLSLKHLQQRQLRIFISRKFHNAGDICV